MDKLKQTRLNLTLFYALIMGIFLVTIIFSVHMIMNWSMFSEQSREIYGASKLVEESQLENSNDHDEDDDKTSYYKTLNGRVFFYIFNDDKKLVRFERAPYLLEQFVKETIENWNILDGEVEIFRHVNEAGQVSTVMMMSKKIIIDDVIQTLYIGKDVTVLYAGLQKATFAQGWLGILALIIASIIGYFMAGHALEPLIEAYNKQKQFAADASHELRTPLAIVMSSAELLLTDPSIKNPFFHQILEDLKSEVKKMSKLVSDLLLVTRSDNDELKIKLQRINLTNIFKQIIRTMAPIAEKKKIYLHGEGFRKIIITADEQRIKQLLLILVDNAIKYTPEDGSIILRVERVDDVRVIFSVIDNGVGVAAEDLDKIFDRFYRVDKARSREMGGNGLGLSIAEEIVKIHNGKISVESKLGEGTKFTIELKVNLKNPLQIST